MSHWGTMFSTYEQAYNFPVDVYLYFIYLRCYEKTQICSTEFLVLENKYISKDEERCGRSFT